MGLTVVGTDRAKDAVASMIKRLAHRNANVQLYTLEVRWRLQAIHSSDDNVMSTASECALTELWS